MGYRSDPIPNIRTIKAIRGESLTIDLSKDNPGDLRAWMKKDPSDKTYRSFEIKENGRKLFLSKTKASDYFDTNGKILEAIKGKWYFDVEQILDPLKPEEVKTIYRGTILFNDDVTGSVGIELTDPNTGELFIIIEVADFSALPIPGDDDVLYITLNDNRQWRWTGTQYIENTTTIPANIEQRLNDLETNSLNHVETLNLNW